MENLTNLTNDEKITKIIQSISKFDENNVIAKKIRNKLKNYDMRMICQYDVKMLSFDDYYCVIMYDVNNNPIVTLFWDFDLVLYDNVLQMIKNDYRFISCNSFNDVLKCYE